VSATGWVGGAGGGAVRGATRATEAFADALALPSDEACPNCTMTHNKIVDPTSPPAIVQR
jgi:hypothetical protein